MSTEQKPEGENVGNNVQQFPGQPLLERLIKVAQSIAGNNNKLAELVMSTEAKQLQSPAPPGQAHERTEKRFFPALTKLVVILEKEADQLGRHTERLDKAL
jgi:hypothetical protein